MTERPKKANSLEPTSKAVPGVICKTASAKPMAIGEDDMAKINRFTLADLKAEDVFCFKVAMCDNESDDRNFAPFDRKALDDLKELYVGKTVIKDHSRMADNQVGRIYDTEIVEADENAESGEAHAELFAKVYMVRTDGNADLIKEIAGGIKKEVSTSCTPEKMVCSVCGTDNMKDWCKHWPGEAYEVEAADGSVGEQTCRMLLHGATDAYELSFVAVPAQPRAGARKAAEWFAKPCEEPADVGKELHSPEEDGDDLEKAETAALECELAMAEAFIFTHKEG